MGNFVVSEAQIGAFWEWFRREQISSATSPTDLAFRAFVTGLRVSAPRVPRIDHIDLHERMGLGYPVIEEMFESGAPLYAEPNTR